MIFLDWSIPAVCVFLDSQFFVVPQVNIFDRATSGYDQWTQKISTTFSEDKKKLRNILKFLTCFVFSLLFQLSVQEVSDADVQVRCHSDCGVQCETSFGASSAHPGQKRQSVVRHGGMRHQFWEEEWRWTQKLQFFWLVDSFRKQNLSLVGGRYDH